MSRDEFAIRRGGLETEGEALSYEMAATAARAASEMFAKAVTLVDLRGVVSYTDYFVIASAETERQTRRVAEEILAHLSELPPLEVEAKVGERWGQVRPLAANEVN